MQRVSGGVTDPRGLESFLSERALARPFTGGALSCSHGCARIDGIVIRFEGSTTSIARKRELRSSENCGLPRCEEEPQKRSMNSAVELESCVHSNPVATRQSRGRSHDTCAWPLDLRAVRHPGLVSSNGCRSMDAHRLRQSDLAVDELEENDGHAPDVNRRRLVPGGLAAGCATHHLRGLEPLRAADLRQLLALQRTNNDRHHKVCEGRSKLWFCVPRRSRLRGRSR